MGIFDYKRVVSPQTFKNKVRTELYEKGWPEQKIRHVEEVMHGYMDADKNTSRHGMDAKDVEHFVDYVKKNHMDIEYSDHEIQVLHESLKKHLL